MKINPSNLSAGINKFLLFFSCLWLTVSLARADDLVVLKGSSTRIALPDGIKRVMVANPIVIDAKPTPDGLAVLVTGLAEGSSNLHLEGTQGSELVTNVVVRSDLNQMLAQIKDLLSEVEGLEISIVGDKIVLRGKILTKSDYDQVVKVAGAYSTVVLNLAKFDDSIVGPYVEQAILKDIGLDGITARVVNDTVVLEGVVNSQADLKRAEEIAHLKIPNVKNLLRVQEVMIETDVQFIEVTSANGNNFGQNLFGVLGASANVGGTIGTGTLPIQFGIAATPTIASVFGGNGYGLSKSSSKIVAEPQISTKSGETGSFQQGGTKYFSVAGNVGGLLQSVDYGVILKVKPTLQGHDQILNDVSIEVSMPVSDPTGVLTLDKYSTTCSALCKIGESMVLSGITQKQQARSTADKTPVLGDVPLLNLFFSNKQSSRQQSEYVIVLTPRPLVAAPATGAPFSEQNKQLLNDKDKKD